MINHINEQKKPVSLPYLPGHLQQYDFQNGEEKESLGALFVEACEGEYAT